MMPTSMFYDKRFRNYQSTFWLLSKVVTSKCSFILQVLSVIIKCHYCIWNFEDIRFYWIKVVSTLYCGHLLKLKIFSSNYLGPCFFRSFLINRLVKEATLYLDTLYILFQNDDINRNQNWVTKKPCPGKSAQSS